MKIFNQKTVIGLFDRDKDVEKAVSKLQAHGYGKENDDEIRIFDQYRLPQETPVDAPEQQTLTQSGQGPIPGPAGTFFEPIKDAGTESATVRQTIRKLLEGFGLNDEEARFHAMHVARGNALLVVDTTKDRAAEAVEIMKQVKGVVSEA